MTLDRRLLYDNPALHLQGGRGHEHREFTVESPESGHEPHHQFFEGGIPIDEPESATETEEERERKLLLARCPYLNLEFLWKQYHRRHNRDSPDDHKKKAEILESQGFPDGLAKLIVSHSDDQPVRIWLLDNCGTMNKSDGHYVVQNSAGKVEIVDCTRWEEVASCAKWHAEFAAWCQIPMAFRMLHDPGSLVGPQQLGISASKQRSCAEELERLKSLLKKTRPMGTAAPIQWHLSELFSSIEPMVPFLQQTKKFVSICICVDSIPTDDYGKESPKLTQELIVTLLQLASWQVHVTIRLSTDEKRVVQFYRSLTRGYPDLESCFQVLDDYVGECALIQEHNPWLNYGYPLHLCREEGVRLTLVEALSRRKLTVHEITEVCALIFGVYFDRHAYHPEANYEAFRKQIENLNKQKGVLWNPLKKKYTEWVDLKKLDKCCGHKTKSKFSIFKS